LTTHENELTAEVDLCTPDGDRLNPAARGWSRRPLHRANLRGHFGVNKKWDYWAVLAGDIVVSCVYADIDHLGLADVWWADLASGSAGGKGVVTAGNEDFDLPDRPGTSPLRINRDGFWLEIADDAVTGTHLRSSWSELDGRLGRLDAVVALPAGHESLNVVIPWSDELFNYTSKHQARPATGSLTVGDRTWALGGETGDAWGVLDVGRGRWPAEIVWNWGGGAGRSGDHVVGLQFGAKWTAGSGYTENGVIVDGVLTKIGRELEWTYDWDEPLRPWRVSDPGGQLDVILEPRYDKHTQLPGRDRGSETHQVFGTWAGRLRTDDGIELEFERLQGFAEEARQEW
jgi:Domain of unknown function (DUF2804), N-terminal/Domain of unknown function (DUF2804), C-terminal